MRRQFRHTDHRKMNTSCRVRVFKALPLAVMFLVIITSALALAQSSPKDDTGRLIALERAWNRAIEAKDSKALDPLLASTFIAADIDGSLTRKGEFLASIKDPWY